MTDGGTASTLIFFGAIFQLLFSIGFLTIGLLLLPFALALFALDPFVGSMVLTVVFAYFVFWLFGLIFLILWFRWRNKPSTRKKALIITGVLGLFLAGVLPGLFVLIGGILTPGEEINRRSAMKES